MALKFTDENFKKEVLEADLLCIVDFYADWCGPCKMMAPVIDQLAVDHDGEVKIGKLNTDESPLMATKYKVMTIPTILFIKNGEVLDTLIGVVSQNSLEEKIKLYL